MQQHSSSLLEGLNLPPKLVESVITEFRNYVAVKPSTKRWSRDQRGSCPGRQVKVTQQWTARTREDISCIDGNWMLSTTGTPSAVIVCMEDVPMFIINHLTAGKSRNQIRQMVKFTPGLLDKDVRHVFDLIDRGLPLGLLPEPTSIREAQHSCPFSQYQDEQRYLFYNDPRGVRLRDYYKQQLRCRPKTLQKIRVEVLRASRSLEAAIPGKARHPGCSCTPDGDADWLIMTEDDHYKWAENPTLDIVVIRDKSYIERSSEPFSAQQFREDLGKIPRGSTVTIQDWSKKAFQMAAERVLVSKALEGWDSSDPTDNRPPRNILSIEELRRRSPPCGFSKYYTFLDRAITYSNIASMAAIDPSHTKIGKGTLRLANDISACRRFTLLGERGMSSGSHIDLMGVSTGATIEPSTHHTSSGPVGSISSLLHDNSSPLKYWLVVSMKDCTEDQKAQEMRRFADLGATYIPELPARFIAI